MLVLLESLTREPQRARVLGDSAHGLLASAAGCPAVGDYLRFIDASKRGLCLRDSRSTR
jgi:hypothetical protein